jgi:hypothetical protein
MPPRRQPNPNLRLNRGGFDHAASLIDRGLVVIDDRDQWSEHQPSAEDGNRFIAKFGIQEYAEWHLAVDTAEDESNKERYHFPYGDFHKVHRCGVLSAEVRAGQYNHREVERAAAHLRGMIDSLAAVRA